LAKGYTNEFSIREWIRLDSKKTMLYSTFLDYLRDEDLDNIIEHVCGKSIDIQKYIDMGIFDSNGEFLTESLRQFLFLHYDARNGHGEPYQFFDIFDGIFVSESLQREKSKRDFAETYSYKGVELQKDFKGFKRGETFEYIIYSPNSRRIIFVRDGKIIHMDFVKIEVK
jgi:hypothetical protein